MLYFSDWNLGIVKGTFGVFFSYRLVTMLTKYCPILCWLASKCLLLWSSPIYSFFWKLQLLAKRIIIFIIIINIVWIVWIVVTSLVRNRISIGLTFFFHHLSVVIFFFTFFPTFRLSGIARKVVFFRKNLYVKALALKAE